LNVFRFFLLFGIASMLFLINGCNDTPNSVGVGSLNKADFGIVHIDTFYATANSIDTSFIYTSSIDRFMLGKYKTYQAWTCLKFYGWPDSLVGAKITGATIRLKGVYHFGDSLASLSFTAYRGMSNLFGDSLTYDSLNLNSVNSVNGVYYNNIALPIQTVLPAGDTMSMTINFTDMTMFREWFSTNTDTVNLNDGLLLRPTNSNIIKGFFSFSASDTSQKPVLYITYLDTNGNTNSYSHKVGMVKYVSTVDQGSLISNPNLVYIQSGIAYRGLVSFDSISKISNNWPVSVYRAVLQVTLNSSQSSSQFTPFYHDSIYALSAGTNGQSDGGAYGVSQRNDSTGIPLYSIEVRNIAIRMLSNASVRKIVLSNYGENSCFDLHTVYGSVSDKKLKPRIIITYSVQR
jgi:hypothetical protein